MTIEEKLDEFLRIGELPSTLVGQSALVELGINRGGFLAKCFFEPSVNLESEVISRQRTCFIGAHSYMNAGGYMRSGVFIGRFCSIGRRVSIAAGSHPIHGVGTHPKLVNGQGRSYDDSERRMLGIRPPRREVTVIGNDVWIGDGAVILPGVVIGDGAVIGANSVVTRDVPGYVVAAGVPAKVLRLRFPEDVAAALLATRWWNQPIEHIRSLPVRNVFDFVREFGPAPHFTSITSYILQT